MPASLDFEIVTFSEIVAAAASPQRNAAETIVAIAKKYLRIEVSLSWAETAQARNQSDALCLVTPADARHFQIGQLRLTDPRTAELRHRITGPWCVVGPDAAAGPE
jgi:hypothetical protein